MTVASRDEAIRLLRSGPEGVRAWNEWRKQRVGRDWGLGGAELEGACLRGVDFAGEYLGRAQFGSADLRFANFRGADLKGASMVRARCQAEGRQFGVEPLGTIFTDANLEDALLVEANLEGAEFSHANLTDANFEGANLQKTWFYRANLRLSDLRGANLTDANLREAYLYNVRLANCKAARLTFWETTIANVDLSTLFNDLREAKHLAPSTIGVDTLSKSRGMIPNEFLRGCGLADWQIESAKLHRPDLTDEEHTQIAYEVLRLLAGSPIQVNPIFISYSHENSDFVDRLALEFDKCGVRYWRDIKDATAGPLDKVLQTAIRLTPTFLIVLSEDAVKSGWVQYEIETAVAHSLELGRATLCPVMLDAYWLHASELSGHIKTQLRRYLVLDFSGWRDLQQFSDRFDKLLGGIRAHHRASVSCGK